MFVKTNNRIMVNSMSKSRKQKNRYIFIYATFPAKKTVLSISQKLIQKKLVVCANISEHDAIYFWNGRLYQEKEYVVFFKTREDKWKKAKNLILKKHPYQTPVILKFRIQGHTSGFKDWMDESLTRFKKRNQLP